MAFICVVVGILLSHAGTALDAAPKAKTSSVPQPDAIRGIPRPVSTEAAETRLNGDRDADFPSLVSFPFSSPSLDGEATHYFHARQKLPPRFSGFADEITGGPFDLDVSFPFSSLHPYGALAPFETVGPFHPRASPLVPVGNPPGYCKQPATPLCAGNGTRPWCLIDYDYPVREIEQAIHQHRIVLLALYAEVADLSTGNSVVRPLVLYEETYLCPAEVAYVKPLRAVNTKGRWRTIVNNVKLGYDILTQTARMEECLAYRKPCPLVPACYQSTCIQKSAYQRFLVYDPCDRHFPFTIESFKLPSACSCVVDKYHPRY